jgi:hypothetical protein
MKEWKWAYCSDKLDEVLKELEQRKKRELDLLSTGERYYKGHFKTMKYRLMKIDCEEMELNEK